MDQELAIEQLFKLYTNEVPGAHIRVSRIFSDPDYISLETIGDASTDYFGEVNLVLEKELATNLANALLKLTEETLK